MDDLLMFLAGGAATSAACLFTNPIEVVKTRMQLQGELSSREGAANANKLYKNPFQAFRHIAVHEGWRGIQGGIVPACSYQFVMNGGRLGSYSLMHKYIIAKTDNGFLGFLSKMGAGAMAGVFGAIIASPLFLVKTRMQADSSTCTRRTTARSIQCLLYLHFLWCSSPVLLLASCLSLGVKFVSHHFKAKMGSAGAVGTQHRYTGMWSALRSIWSEEGPTGLMRGARAAAMRVGVGSSVQLSVYDTFKEQLQKASFLPFTEERVQRDRTWAALLHFSASLCSGLCVVTCMNPFDVVSTRLYNQPVKNGVGLLYKGLVDCMMQTAKSEGLAGFYKGYWAHYLRLGPHTVLTFVFFEQLLMWIS